MMNRKTLFSILAGAAALLVLLAGIWIGRTTGPETVSAGAPDEHVHEAAETVETIWTCSMHPQVRQPAPGQCPICGMDLIPAASGAGDEIAGDLPRLVLSDRAVALIDVRTWPVERREVEREIRLPGMIDYDERRVGTISARFPGRLEKLYVNFTGTYVEQGEPMAEIYSPALISAQEELLQALRMQESENALLDAARDRLRLLGLTDEQVGEIEEAGKVMDRITISSPMSGIVTERLASEGSYVETGQAIYSVVDLSELWVNLEAYESDLTWLSVGQSVTFVTQTRPGERLGGTIAFIDPVVNESSRTANIRVDLENPGEWLKPGMFIRGTVHSMFGADEEDPPLVIPATAPLITGERAIVYVKVPDADAPTFEAREILLGPKTRSHYVVFEGLEEGEIVVTRGSFQIDSELQIRGRPSMMAPAEPEQVAETIHEVTPLVNVDAVPAAFGQQINRFAQAYLDLTEALAADDLEAARMATEAMRRRLGEIDSSLLADDALAAWTNLHDDLQPLLADLAGADSLPGIRTLLQPLTNAVETAVVSFHGGQVGSLYKAYCPMALDNQGGTWLQRSDSIANAYFGAAMHQCGDIVNESPLDLPGASDDSR